MCIAMQNARGSDLDTEGEIEERGGGEERGEDICSAISCMKSKV